MDEISLPAPTSVPKDLSRPSQQYKRHVWLALAALLLFVALYLALTGWFAWSAYRLVRGALGGGKDAFFGFLWAAPMAFLALFMLKALFFRDKRSHARDFEIKPEQEPRVFEYLHRIADAAGAPRPHRVFLSPQVNASVFYDLSILNLLIPSKKNLDIGLGLINALSLGEVSAVLAHEFGHFGQRAMAVGRWVYVAQRIAAHIVNKRDALDKILMVISSSDLRVAWIGWLMRIVVWSLRSILDTAFALVVLAERALSREMEMQADLVAVSLTGSDALVHALHKLAAADAAWDQALGVCAGEYASGKSVPDLFTLQTRVMQRARQVLADENHGVAPPLPSDGRAQHRVFEQRMAHPPRMWSSHPPNHEREENAKRVYVACELDERSPWLLFRDPPALRKQMTEFFQGFLDKPKEGVQPISEEEAQKSVDQRFDRAYLDPRYRGAYLRRSVVRNTRRVEDLYLPTERRVGVDLSDLYPERLRHALERWKSLEEERDMLQGLQRGILQAGGGNIRFRGSVLRRQDLPPTLDKVSAECAAARAELDEFDRQHRTAHALLAERLGQGWPEYLHSLLALLHYADHTEANMRDARGHLTNVFSVVTADGRVSKGERKRLAAAGADVFMALQSAFEQRQHVVLPREIAQELEIDSWAAALPDNFGLVLPDADHIGEWLEVVDSWLDAFIAPFDALERCTLEALLKNEARVAEWARIGAAPESSPAPARVPGDYPRLLPGSERERQWRLGFWDRFQIAEGLGPSLARFTVAGGCVAATVMASASVGDSKVVIYNGLGRPVVVRIGEQRRELAAYQAEQLEDVDAPKLHVRAETTKGELIEQFDVELSGKFEQYVYNVASAAPLVRWTAVYGSGKTSPRKLLGTPRWSTTDARVLFQLPPKKVSSKSRGSTREVLSGPADEPPVRILSLLTDSASRSSVVRAHALWDEPGQLHTGEWLAMASSQPEFSELLRARLGREPNDVLALRLEQDSARGAERTQVCERHKQLAGAANGNPDFEYLVLRCQSAGPERDRAFLQASERFPQNPWLAFSAGNVHARRGDWKAALRAYRVGRSAPGMSDELAMVMARLLRVLGREGASALKQLAESSVPVKQRLALETVATDLPKVESPYAAIIRGHLSGALESAAADEPSRARVLRLVAASKGASSEQVRDALTLSDREGIDADTIWPAIALNLKNKQSADTLIARLQEFTEEGELEAAREFLTPEKLLKNPARTEQLLAQLSPVTRGHVYVMAAVLLGDKAPEPWLEQLRALLFADERPRL
ncbi:MAG: M48 family metallopeptidase [Myxococcota bacterium]